MAHGDQINIMWGARHGGMGLQHNDLKLLKVLRCNNSSKIPYMGPKTKTLSY
jgi:hypothetical protein